jgi:hypothetical protein
MVVFGNPRIRQAQRADGPACVLAIGTANPANCMRQDEYADYYFRVTNSEHLTELKAKFNRICCYPACLTKFHLLITQQLANGPSSCSHGYAVFYRSKNGYQEALLPPHRGIASGPP